MAKQSVKWNLGQAIAWVMTRDEGIVQIFEKEWIFNLASYPLSYGFCDPVDKKKARQFLGDKNDLLEKLRDGSILVSGQVIERGSYKDERQNIPASEWQWLELKTSAPSGENRVEAFGDGVPSWRNLYFSSNSLKRHFPRTPIKSLLAPDINELENIMKAIVLEYRQSGQKINRSTLHSEVNSRLQKGEVSHEWAKSAIQTIPGDIKHIRGRPKKNAQ